MRQGVGLRSCLGAVLCAVAVLANMSVPVAGAAAVDPAVVRDAIRDAVIARMGPTATVLVEVTDVRVTDEIDQAIVAVPDQGARAGQPARFTLFAQGRRRVRLGEATAVLAITADVTRVRRAVGRGEVLRVTDLEAAHETLQGSRLVAPVSVTAMVGSRAARDLASGSQVTAADLVTERAVASGDRVRATVRLAPGVEVSGVAVAMQSGQTADVITVMNPESRQTRRARVTGRGEVEMIDVP